MRRIVWMLALTMGLCGQVKGDDFESLIKNSPFGIDENRVNKISTPTDRPLGVPTSATNYELRGFFIGENISLFNVYTAADGKCRWIRRGGNVDGIAVDSFDIKLQTLYFHTPDNTSRSVQFKHVPGNIRQLGITI